MAQADGIEEFGSPWGRFAVPAPGAEILDSVLQEIFVDRAYENQRVTVNPDDVVVDCGAHVGVFTRFAIQNGARRVISIEMESANFECLRRNMGSIMRAEAVQAALWSYTSRVSLDRSTFSDRHRLAGENLDGELAVAQPLDDILHSLDIDRVDFVKIDVEGREVEALEGAIHTLQQHRPKLAIATYHEASEESRIRQLFSRHGLPYSWSYKTFIGDRPFILFGAPC